MDIEVYTLFIITIAMGLGGLIKGLSAFGLPFITVPLLVQVFPVPTAIALTVLPILFTNAYQMVHGGHLKLVLKRLWPMIISLMVFLFFSVNLLLTTADSALIAVIGVGMLIYVIATHFGIKISVKESQETWVGALVGASSGILGGLTSFYGMPALFYIIALRMTKEQFVCAVAATLFAGATVMAYKLLGFGILTRGEILLSTISLGPLFLGLVIGQKLRSRINQERFQLLVRIVLGLMGVSMIVRGALT